ncbi:hypothetical protein JOM56_013167 [Amanita muscaria]
MPPKASKAKLQVAAANARAKKAVMDDGVSVEVSLDDITGKYDEALEKIKALELELAEEKERAAEMGSSLVAAKVKASQLAQELKHERQRYQELYKELRVEHRARQCNKAKKESLLEQIELLHLAAVESRLSTGRAWPVWPWGRPGPATQGPGSGQRFSGPGPKWRGRGQRSFKVALRVGPGADLAWPSPNMTIHLHK